MPANYGSDGSDGSDGPVLQEHPVLAARLCDCRGDIMLWAGVISSPPILLHEHREAAPGQGPGGTVGPPEPGQLFGDGASGTFWNEPHEQKEVK